MKSSMVLMASAFFLFALSACGGGGGSDSDDGSTSIKVQIQDDLYLTKQNPNLLIHLMTSDFGTIIEEQTLNLLENDEVIFHQIEPGTYGVDIIFATSGNSPPGAKNVITITDGEELTLFCRWGSYGNYVTIGDLTIRASKFIVDVFR